MRWTGTGPHCSSVCPPCTTACSRQAGLRARAAAVVRLGLGTAVGRAPCGGELGYRQRGTRAIRDDGDAHEHIQPLPGGAAAGDGRVRSTRGRGWRSTPRGRCCFAAPTSSTATSSAMPPTAMPFGTSVTAADPGSPPGTSGADEDGYLVIRGRSTELIISGGFNVYPTEVEDVLSGYPGVGRGGRHRHAVGRVG